MRSIARSICHVPARHVGAVCASAPRRADAARSLTLAAGLALGLSLLASGALVSGAHAQPFSQGQTAQTRAQWAGFSVPGTSPLRTLSTLSASAEAALEPLPFGFSTTINGGAMSFTSGQRARTTPESSPSGVRLRAGADMSVTTNRVTSAIYSSTASSIWTERLRVDQIREPERALSALSAKLTFVLNGSMSRASATGRDNASVSVNLTNPAGSTFSTLYSDQLGGTRTYLGATSPNTAGELSRSVSNLSISFNVALQAGAASDAFSLVLNSVTGFSALGSNGASGSASSDFFGGSLGLSLQTIQFFGADGREIPRHVISVSGSSGTDYDGVVLPAPGAAALLAMAGLVASQRRRTRA